MGRRQDSRRQLRTVADTAAYFGVNPHAAARSTRDRPSMASTFVRNSVVNALAGIFTTLGGFLSTIVVARLLGVQGTGIVAFATWAVTVSIIIADLGITGTLTRFLPELLAKHEVEEAGRLTRVLLGSFFTCTFVIAAAFWLYAAWLIWRAPLQASVPLTPETYTISPIFWILVGGACLAQSMANFANSWLKGHQDFAALARVAAFACLVQILGTAVGAMAFGVIGALCAMALGSLVPISMLSRVEPLGGRIDAVLRRRVTRFSLETWGGYLLTAFFASRMEVFFLERSWGSHAVGLFTVSLTLSNLATQGPLLLTGALLPRLSQHVGRDEQGEARAVYAASIPLMALVLFPACLGTAAIAPVLLPMMYGPAFEPAITTATILLTSAAFVTSTSIASVFLIAMERTRFLLASALCGAALSILAGVTIVPAFGPVAAAFSRGGVQLIIAVVTLWYLRRHLDCPTPFGILARLLGAAALCAVVARLIVIEVPSLSGMIVAIVAGAATYAAALRILRPLLPRDVEKLRTAVLILPRHLRPAVHFGMQLILA